MGDSVHFEAFSKNNALSRVSNGESKCRVYPINFQPFGEWRKRNMNWLPNNRVMDIVLLQFREGLMTPAKELVKSRMVLPVLLMQLRFPVPNLKGLIISSFAAH